MDVIEEKSFYGTVTNAAQVLFDGGSFNETEKTQLASWILDHQNRYKGFIFYPSEQDREDGIRLFSGEKPRSKFLADNSVELEALRLLALIYPNHPEAHRIFQDANERLLPLCFARGCIVGECAHAGIAFRRYFMTFDGDESSEKNRQTLETLKQRRYGEGKWRDFPFYFTLLWLTELPDDLAQEELEYTRDYCRELSRKLAGDEPFVDNRRNILMRVLDQ